MEKVSVDDDMGYGLPMESEGEPSGEDSDMTGQTGWWFGQEADQSSATTVVVY